MTVTAYDAVEKITAIHPQLLQPYKEKFINRVAGVNQQEARWHVAQMLPRIVLSGWERETVVDILFGDLNDKSKIVKTFWLQALSEFAEQDERLRSRVVDMLEKFVRTGSSAVKSRGKKLLAKLKNEALLHHKQKTNTWLSLKALRHVRHRIDSTPYVDGQKRFPFW